MLLQKLARVPSFMWSERASLIAVATKIAGAASSFLVIFIVARYSGATVTGDYALALATATTVSLFAIMGLDLIVIRNVSGDLRLDRADMAWGAVRSALWKIVPASLLFSTMLALLSPYASHIGASPKTILAISGSIVALPLLRIGIAVFRAMGSIILSQFADSAHAHLLVALTLLWLWQSAPIDGPLIALFYTISVSTVTCAIWIFLLIKTRGWPRNHTDDRPTLHTSWKILLSTVAQSLTSWLLLAQVGIFLGASEAGAYRVAGQITLTIGLVVTTLGPIAAPGLATQVRLGNMEGVWRHYRRSTRLMTLAAVIPVALCLIVPRHLLSVFGPEFVIAATALWILSLGQLVNAITGPIGVLTVMSGNEHITLVLSVVGLALTLGMSIVLIPQFGLVGAAVSAVTPTIFRGCAQLTLMRRKLSGK